MAFKTTKHRTHLRLVREVEAIGGNVLASGGRQGGVQAGAHCAGGTGFQFGSAWQRLFVPGLGLSQHQSSTGCGAIAPSTLSTHPPPSPPHPTTLTHPPCALPYPCRAASREQMAYTIDTSKASVPEALELLTDAVLNPKFQAWEVAEQVGGECWCCCCWWGGAGPMGCVGGDVDACRCMVVGECWVWRGHRDRSVGSMGRLDSRRAQSRAPRPTC